MGHGPLREEGAGGVGSDDNGGRRGRGSQLGLPEGRLDIRPTRCEQGGPPLKQEEPGPLDVQSHNDEASSQ